MSHRVVNAQPTSTLSVNDRFTAVGLVGEEGAGDPGGDGVAQCAAGAEQQRLVLERRRHGV